MTNKTITFEYEIKMPLLTGYATLKIKEWSFILSEKSLYGAGTTRFSHTITLNYNGLNSNNDNDNLEIISFSSQEKQSIFKPDDDLDTVAKAFIEKSISNYLFEITEELEQEQNYQC